MSVLKKLGTIDKRIVYVCILIVGCYFSVFAIGLPVPTKPWVKDFYQTIETLQPGDLILFQASITPSTVESFAGIIPVLQHIFSIEGVKVVVYSLPPYVDMVEERLEKANPESYGKVYGIDWINLGYIAGGETAVAALASDIKGLVSVDVYGDDLNNYELWNEINDILDFDYLMCASGTSPGTAALMRQIQVPYGTPILEVGGAGGLSTSMPYYETGQYVGALFGFTDNAAYEILINKPGINSRSTDVMSMLHVTVVIFIIIANISHLSLTFSKGGK